MAVATRGMEGVRRTTGIPLVDAEIDPPDPEVPEKKPRRKFTAQYKLEVLKKADACTQPGQVGALLRAEGLYSSNLTHWRKQRAKGQLNALSPKKRGRKAITPNPLAKKVAELERQNRKLTRKLKQAETIIEVQKKISEILGVPLEDPNSDENS